MKPRYKKLGYVALNVTNISSARRFYEEEFGLQYSGSGKAGEVYLRCSTDHHNLILYPAARPGLKRIGWEMENDDELDEVVETLRSLGHTVHALSEEGCRALHQGKTYRVAEPNTGATLEFYSIINQFSAQFAPTVARIRYIGHVVIKTPKLRQVTDFFTEVLNFRISDMIGDRAIFLRCFPNPCHHSMAIIHSEEDGLHHVNFVVADIDDIGRSLARFKRKQVPVVYGPGRHPASGSVFLYFLDPDGLTLEYSLETEQFPEENPRKHRVYEVMRESFDYWGSEVDPRNASVGVIELGVELADCV